MQIEEILVRILVQIGWGISLHHAKISMHFIMQAQLQTKDLQLVCSSLSGNLITRHSKKQHNMSSPSIQAKIEP